MRKLCLQYGIPFNIERETYCRREKSIREIERFALKSSENMNNDTKYVPADKENMLYSMNDAYEYFNYCISNPKVVELRMEITKKLTYDLLKDEQKRQEKLKKNTKSPIEIKQEEVMAIRNRFPTKIPVVVSRLPKERYLPKLEKNKYLVPKEITLGQFIVVLRSRMQLSKNKSIYLLIGNKSIICPTLTMAEVYKNYCNEDGYLYVTYASQETFGNTS